MSLLDRALETVKVKYTNAVDVAAFVRKHRLTRDPTIKDRYWLTGAQDRYIDADLTDPEVRESAEILIREFRTKVTVKKGRPEKEKETGVSPFGKIDLPKMNFTIRKRS